MRCVLAILLTILLSLSSPLSDSLWADGTRSTETYKRIKTAIDAVPSVDTHDHLWPFEKLPALTETKEGKQVNLSGIWRNSYLPGYNAISPWQADDTFDSWWSRAKHNFDNVRSASFSSRKVSSTCPTLQSISSTQSP